MDNLTPRQRQIYNLIADHIDDTGFPPTRAEIAETFGFRSANAAEEHLRALERKGVIEMTPGASRGIRLVEEAPAGLPVVGRVAAGSPILATEHIEDYRDVANNLFYPRARYLLRVEGDSMIEMGILDGDLLAVHPQPVAENGQVVVARINGDVTVKRYKTTRSKYRIALLPENQYYDPIEVDLREDDFAIEGLAVGILRESL